MFAVSFRFPAGRYHATPWGKHVNEGDVAWPPEPYRILRALIATWYRKADQTRFPSAMLDKLIERLSKDLPHFYLPEAVHAHTRHYMPGKSKTALVIDAFLHVRPKDALIAVWLDTHLESELFDLAEHLCQRISYFGRAESIAIAEALREYDLDLMNCRPLPYADPNDSSKIACDALAPLGRETYMALRKRTLSENHDKATSKKRILLEKTLPETLREALEVDTSILKEMGWSRPPAGRNVLYYRPDFGIRSEANAQPIRRRPSQSALPTVARLVLAGKPRPRVEETVQIAELFRRALIWKATNGNPMHNNAPAELVGRDVLTNKPAQGIHSHAFFLPEDADGDGCIDHLLLYASNGLSIELQRALKKLQRLWIRDRPSGNEEGGDEGRREWRLALEGFGSIDDFSNECKLLRKSASWTSITPYLRPWHLKGGDINNQTIAMIEKECSLRGLPLLQAKASNHNGSVIGMRSVLAFHRLRSKPNLKQPDRSGTALELTFSEPVAGPIALGFGCHYGLGLFQGIE